VLAREPDNAKFIGAESAREVTRRRALFAKLKPLDDAAGAAFLKHEKLRGAVVAERDAAAAGLRTADQKVWQIDQAKAAELHALTAERDRIEGELIAGADLPAIAAFRREMLDEQEKAMDPRAIVSLDRRTKNRVTGEKHSERVTNAGSIRKRLAAIRDAFPKIDALKLEPDQSKLAERFAEIKAALPAIDDNLEFPDETKKAS
jgi:hypothetical protein